MTQPILGIDLGTTNSAVAIIDEFDQPKVLPNADGDPTTPSVVFFESADAIIVGKQAKNMSRIQPDDTEELIKRAMGETHTFTHFGTPHTAESISSLILKELVRGAFENLQETPTAPIRVVITVPAYFGMQEKQATRVAAEIAGLEVIDLIPEPVAAALAYGARHGSDPKTIFVYDLGGGTFDTTILRVQPDQLEVLIVDGHHRLGGADLDQALIDYVLGEFKAQASPDSDPEDDEVFLSGLALDVEEAKKTLSSRQTMTMALSFAGSALKLELTREKLEELTAGYIQQTMDIVERTLAAGREKVPGLVIDEVLLVGGSSKMPIIKQKLEELIGVAPVSNEPDLSVAKGAAIYAKLEGDNPKPIGFDDDDTTTGDGTSDEGGSSGTGPRKLPGSSGRVVNVLPRAFGILTINTDVTPYRPEVHWLVPAQSSLPVVTISERFSTVSDDTRSIPIQLFEQGTPVPSFRPEDNKEVTPPSGAEITGLPGLPKGSPIDVEIDISADGLAHVSAFEPTTGQKLEIPVLIAGLEQKTIDDLRDLVGGISTS